MNRRSQRKAPSKKKKRKTNYVANKLKKESISKRCHDFSEKKKKNLNAILVLINNFSQFIKIDSFNKFLILVLGFKIKIFNPLVFQFF